MRRESIHDKPSNTLAVPFYVRQKKFIALWCKRQDITKTNVYRLQCEINGWKVPQPRGKTSTPLPPLSLKEKSFIENQRRLLCDPKNLSEEWLKSKSNRGTILKYYYHILECYTVWEEGKKFTLAPISHIRTHFMTIDTVTLYELLTNIGATILNDKGKKEKVLLKVHNDDENIETIDLMTYDSIDAKKKLWGYVLDTTGLRRKMTFGDSIETDAVTMCVHFHWTLKKQKKRAKRIAFKRKHQTAQVQAEAKPPQRLISIDPGRSNLIKGYDWELDMYYNLTSKTYYLQSGINKRFQKTSGWDVVMRPIIQKLSCHPIRSIQEQDNYLYLQTIIRNYDRLWSHYTALKRRRLDFTVYGGKNRALDRFFNTMVEVEIPRVDPDTPRASQTLSPVIKKKLSLPKIAYGACSLSPTGKGEKSVPVKYIAKKCEARFPLDYTDEGFSTQMHEQCRTKMHAVYDKKTKLPVRGLRWCSTCRKFVDRDGNACKNIGIVSMSTNGRPKYLTRNQPETIVDRPDLFIAEKREKKPLSKRRSAALKVNMTLCERKRGSGCLWGTRLSVGLCPANGGDSSPPSGN